MNILNDNPIGFFDSGVGGLTVLNKVKRLLPYENCVFYGDTEHVPYGDKSKSQLLKYSDNILKFFETKKCKAVVMACNTTSSIIYDDIKDRYNFKLYPVVQSVAKIFAQLPIRRLGVFATKATIQSNAYSNEIYKYNKNLKVFGQYCPEWVRIVENNLLDDEDSVLIIKRDLEKMMDNNPDKIVLGCTHYPYLSGIISKFIPNSMLIDPAIPFAQFIADDLSMNNLLKSEMTSSKDEFYVSENPKQFKDSAQLFYKLEKLPELLRF